jgi:hypothetical protein
LLRVEPKRAGSRSTVAIAPAERQDRSWKGTMRNRTRGIALIAVALIGLVAEAISTIQDGIGGPKVIALACFAFLFWSGWELRQRARSQ